MPTTSNQNEKTFLRSITRREFLRLAALTGLLAGCGPVVTPVAPLSATPAPIVTASPAATHTPVPAATHTPMPAATPTVVSIKSGLRRPDIIKMFPAAPSQVVHTKHAGVWSGDALVPVAIREMLDASITKLTGLNDAKQAWQALFQPNEKIAIKVNAFRNSIIWTHVPLVRAITDSLLNAGIPAEQIVVFDFTSAELETAGFKINKDGPGVRVYGTDGDYASKIQVGANNTTRLSNVLLNSDALINIPILKSHMIAGMTFALKNHYGTVENPDGLHNVGNALPGLNALPEIKQRTRLVIGDLLEACLNHSNGYPYWKSDFKGDSILMSYDPIAHDTVGLNMLKDLKTARGDDPTYNLGLSKAWFENAGKLGLGAHDAKDIQLTEIALK